jgi:hypothetical protein
MRKSKKIIVNALLGLLVILNISSCKVYSLTGVNIDYNKIKTVSVLNFINEAGAGPANLAQSFTEKLRIYMIQNTSLRLVNSGGDLQYDGSIVMYTVSSVAAGQANLATQNRLTMAVKCNYLNTVEEEKSFQGQTVSNIFDFPFDQTLSQIETKAIEDISNRIIFDIFTKSVANW